MIDEIVIEFWLRGLVVQSTERRGSLENQTQIVIMNEVTICLFTLAFQVSWIRKADLHVLTTDVLTFTGDQRFSAHHSTNSDTWTLQIKYTQLRDTGEYQCQVNTEPKISFSVYLTVRGK